VPVKYYHFISISQADRLSDQLQQNDQHAM